MAMPVTDREEVLTSLENSSLRWTYLLRLAGDPSRTAIGHWSIAEVAAHTTHIFGLFPRLLQGGSSPVEDHLRLGEHWDAELARDGERDLDVLAERIERSTKEFIDAARSLDWTQNVSWHGGIRLPAYALASILINECEIHGLDVSRADKKPWKIAYRHAVLTIQGMLPVLPHFVDEKVARGMNGTLELKVRGGPRVYFTLANGELSVDGGAPDRIDVHLSVDPIDYLLIGYGRKGQFGAIAKGKVLTWGRKPWLAMKFGRIFHSV